MTDNARLEQLIREVLVEVGEDPDRTGLRDTPKRVAKAYREMFQLAAPPPDLTVFPRDEDGLNCDQMVVVRDIAFYSHCEHHLVPFFGRVHIGYLPNKHVVGLSKLARVAKHFAARPQVQERLTGQIASYLFENLSPHGVCVIVSAEHMCMSMRGVRAPGHTTTTHAIRGHIDKREVLELLRVSRGV